MRQLTSDLVLWMCYFFDVSSFVDGLWTLDLELWTLLYADIDPPFPPRRSATISASIAKATSSGVTAPMSNPIGARTLASCSAAVPVARKRYRKMFLLCLLLIKQR